MQRKAWKCEVCCIGFDRKMDLLHHMQDKDEDGHVKFVKEIINYSYGTCFLLIWTHFHVASRKCLIALETSCMLSVQGSGGSPRLGLILHRFQ